MIITQRLLAVFVIAIPGILAGYGWNLMRDAIFTSFSSSGEAFPVLKMTGGLILFLAGVAFIAGFFVYRDKKKQEKLMLQNKNPEK